MSKLSSDTVQGRRNLLICDVTQYYKKHPGTPEEYLVISLELDAPENVKEALTQLSHLNRGQKFLLTPKWDKAIDVCDPFTFALLFCLHHGAHRVLLDLIEETLNSKGQAPILSCCERWQCGERTRVDILRLAFRYAVRGRTIKVIVRALSSRGMELKARLKMSEFVEGGIDGWRLGALVELARYGLLEGDFTALCRSTSLGEQLLGYAMQSGGVWRAVLTGDHDELQQVISTVTPRDDDPLLVLAAMGGDFKTVQSVQQHMAAHGRSPSVMGLAGALTTAAICGRGSRLISHLADAGARFRGRLEAFTAMQYAMCCEDCHSTAPLLLPLAAQVGIPQSWMTSVALHDAVALNDCSSYTAVSTCIEHGGRVDMYRKHQHTAASPMYYAVGNDSASVVGELIRAGAAVNIPLSGVDLDGQPIRLQVAEVGSHVNSDSAQYSVLHNARSGFVASLLIKAGASVQNVYLGNTTLHVACKNGHVGVAQELLQARADPNVLNNDSLAPLVYAVAPIGTHTIGAKLQLVKMLRSSGAVATGDCGRYCLLAVVSYVTKRSETEAQLQMVKELLAAGADIFVTDDDGNSVLHRAMVAPSEDPVLIVHLLLERGADPSAKNTLHMLPFEVWWPFRVGLRGCTYDPTCNSVLSLLPGHTPTRPSSAMIEEHQTADVLAACTLLETKAMRRACAVETIEVDRSVPTATSVFESAAAYFASRPDSHGSSNRHSSTCTMPSHGASLRAPSSCFPTAPAYASRAACAVRQQRPPFVVQAKRTHIQFVHQRR